MLKNLPRKDLENIENIYIRIKEGLYRYIVVSLRKEQLCNDIIVAYHTVKRNLPKVIPLSKSYSTHHQ